MSMLSKYVERNVKKFITKKVKALGKKGAILWMVGVVVKHTPTKKDDEMFEVIKKALKGF